MKPTWNIPQISIIGLNGLITNITPSLNNLPGVSGSGGPCHAVDCTQKTSTLCDSLVCNNNGIKGKCTTTYGEGYNCNKIAGCYYDYTVNAPCYQVINTQTCPSGSVLSTSNSDPNSPNSISSVCQYTFSPDNYQMLSTVLPIDFYNSMVSRLAIISYLTGWMNILYNDPDAVSVFHSLNYTNSNKDQIIRTSIPIGIPVSSKFQSFIQSIPTYPVLIYFQPSTGGCTDSCAQINLYVYNTLPGYTGPGSNILTTSEQASDLIRAFTLEPNVSSNLYYPTVSAPLSQSFSNNDYLTNPYYIFVDINNMKIYNNNVTINNNLTNIQTVKQSVPNGDFYIIGRIYNVIVTKWSPNLVYLFSQQTHLTLDQNLCNSIYTFTNQLPLSCFNNMCSQTLSQQCLDLISKKCDRSQIYQTAFKGIQNDAENYFFQNDTGVCYCYNSTLAPPSVTSGNPAAMCFTQNCTANEAIKKAYHLDDDTCKTYCKDVYNWLTSTNVNNRSVQPSVIDAARYKDLCSDYNPSLNLPVFNYYVLGAGLGAGFLLSLLIFAISKKLWLGVIIFIIFIGVAFFFAYDLNGVPQCVNKQEICKGRVTGIPLPYSWCQYELGCECTGFGVPCDDKTKICLQGKCFPNSPPNSP